MPSVVQVEGRERTWRVTVDNLREWSTRSFPHQILETQLYVADNVVFNRDGLVSKRPGNGLYGGGSGATGSGSPSLSGTRFYPSATGGGKLIVHSGTQLYAGTDSTGAFASVGTGLTSARGAFFDQMRDPDMTTGNAVALFVCDGVSIPHVYDGTNYVPVQTGTVGGQQMLPNGVRTGTPITPKYVLNWREHLVYAGDPNDPSALWISDAMRPERFNGYGIIDSAGATYTPYYPGGADGRLGPITGLLAIGPYLVILHQAGVVSAINTGTYGAMQYQFATLSATTGSVAERSAVAFEGFGVFFGGDRFYATDGLSVAPLPDEIPSVYEGTSLSAFPPEMRNPSTVAGARRGLQYWAAYDNVGSGRNTSVVVFDFGANGGWTYGAPAGGAWSRWPTGMQLAWAIECRGPGDSRQMFWGASNQDRIAQHDVGTYDDFGSAITLEARAKAFFLDRPINPKSVEQLNVIGAFPTQGAQYTDTVTAYVVLDSGHSAAPSVAIGVKPSGVAYGSLAYGTFNYGSAQQIIQGTARTYPSTERRGNSVQPGVTESSKNPFNLIGFNLELIMDEPEIGGPVSV